MLAAYVRDIVRRGVYFSGVNGQFFRSFPLVRLSDRRGHANVSIAARCEDRLLIRCNQRLG